ncbi:MAG: hypothetical protein AB7L84_00935 [Acidimicrobiia bacterium]
MSGAGEGASEPPVPPRPEHAELDAEAAEIRRLVEAGAGSPEELRALAERLRAHREREQQLWRRDVRPTLSRRGADSDRSRRQLVVVLGVASAVALLLGAVASGSPMVIAVVVAALAGVAYLVGRRRPTG